MTLPSPAPVTSWFTLLRRLVGAHRQLEALYRHQAVLAFDAEGRVVEANAYFLERLGYGQADLAGRQHRTLVEPQEAALAEADGFWARLRRGEACVGSLYLTASDGRGVWFQAQYSPVAEAGGKVRKVVAYATEITERVYAARARQREFKELQRLVKSSAPQPAFAGAGDGNNALQAAPVSGTHHSTQRMADAAGLVDGILQQTEQLARHAAMQVVRSGDHHHGFALVAGEANSLALRSAEAAREIKQLIGAPAGGGLAGDPHLRETDRLMQRIQSSARRTSSRLESIVHPTWQSDPCLESAPRR